MAKILYWNIENFSANKIEFRTPRRTRGRAKRGREARSAPLGLEHLEAILEVFRPRVRRTTVELDFIVIVEISHGSATEGEPVAGAAMVGVTSLRRYIDIGLEGSWGLVPPIVTGDEGYREAIAVYYRTDKWYFLGPSTSVVPYPARLKRCLPSGSIPDCYPYDPGDRELRKERRRCGQFQFYSSPPNPVPIQFPGPRNRKPWLTAFGDKNDKDHLIRIMAVHTSPETADEATASLAQAHDIAYGADTASKQIDVLVGDFNVDATDPDNFSAGGPFSRLVGAVPLNVEYPYRALIRPAKGLDPRFLSYYHTHGKPAYDSPGEAPARIASDTDEPPPNVVEVGDYPGLAYSDGAIDNALVRHHGTNPPDDHVTILSTVRGQPYAIPNPAPRVSPLSGYYRIGCQMSETVEEMVQIFNDFSLERAASYDINERFRDWNNYGKIRSVSDHFPLLFEV